MVGFQVAFSSSVNGSTSLQEFVVLHSKRVNARLKSWSDTLEIISNLTVSFVNSIVWWLLFHSFSILRPLTKSKVLVFSFTGELFTH